MVFDISHSSCKNRNRDHWPARPGAGAEQDGQIPMKFGPARCSGVEESGIVSSSAN